MLKVILAGAGFLIATPVCAAPIIYSFDGRLSGSLNGTVFDSAAVSFRLIAESEAVFMPRPFDPDLFNTTSTTLNFTIAGVTGDFVAQYNAFANKVGSRTLVGFTETGSNDLIDVTSPALDGYDLMSPTGPVTNRPLDFLNFDTTFATTAGDLVLFNDDNSFVTFRARLLAAAVPEPATWTLMIAGMGLVGAAMRRRSAERMTAIA